MTQADISFPKLSRILRRIGEDVTVDAVVVDEELGVDAPDPICDCCGCGWSVTLTFGANPGEPAAAAAMVRSNGACPVALLGW